MPNIKRNLALLRIELAQSHSDLRVLREIMERTADPTAKCHPDASINPLSTFCRNVAFKEVRIMDSLM